jgi:hypothetical protein
MMEQVRHAHLRPDSRSKSARITKLTYHQKLAAINFVPHNDWVLGPRNAYHIKGVQTQDVVATNPSASRLKMMTTSIWSRMAQ